MGAKQSALKKEVTMLQAEARKRSAKHQEELDAASRDKRQLQLKIDDLLVTVTQAQQEIEKVKNEAREREERMKALKWELVRQLKLTGSPSTSPRSSMSPSSSARIPLNWRLNEDVTLRQSVAPPKKEASKAVETPAPTASTPSVLVAPRRSLLKRAESSAASTSSPNQAVDNEAKASSETIATPDSKSSDFISSLEAKHSDTSPSRTTKSSDESKSDSTDDETPPPKHHTSTSESKENPETNDVHRF